MAGEEGRGAYIQQMGGRRGEGGGREGVHKYSKCDTRKRGWGVGGGGNRGRDTSSGWAWRLGVTYRCMNGGGGGGGSVHTYSRWVGGAGGGGGGEV